MSTMENFLGGKTLAAVKKFADTSDVKELATPLPALRHRC